MSDLTGRQPKALTSALELLEAVAHAGPGVTAAELAAATGLPRATAYRLLNLLVADEYVVRLPDLSGFALGTRVEGLVAAAAPVRVVSAVRSELQELRAGMRPAVHLLLLRGPSVRMAEEDPLSPLAFTGRERPLVAVREGSPHAEGGEGAREWLVVGVAEPPVAVLVVDAPAGAPSPPSAYLDRVLRCAKVLEPLLS